MKKEIPMHKILAKQAKKRLTNGYWNQVKKERELFVTQNSNENCMNISCLKQIYKRKIERELKMQNCTDPDAKLYEKVVKLLSQNEYVLNPISRLIDHSVYDKLDLNAKQVYITKLTDKYNVLKERYNSENQNRIAVN